MDEKSAVQEQCISQNICEAVFHCMGPVQPGRGPEGLVDNKYIYVIMRMRGVCVRPYVGVSNQDLFSRMARPVLFSTFHATLLQHAQSHNGMRELKFSPGSRKPKLAFSVPVGGDSAGAEKALLSAATNRHHGPGNVNNE